MSRKVQCRTQFFDAPQSVGVDIFVLLNWFARFEIKALSLSLSCSSNLSTLVVYLFFSENQVTQGMHNQCNLC